jgi:hypothetical protein
MARRWTGHGITAALACRSGQSVRMTDDLSADSSVQHQVAPADRGPTPAKSTKARAWKWPAIGAVVLLAFLAGLFFPRSWLPGDFATHLPSSCSTTIAKTRDITTSQVANADPSGVEDLRQLVDERPDCFSDQDRQLLSR